MKRPPDDSTRDLLVELPDAVDDVAVRRLRQRIIESVSRARAAAPPRRWSTVTAGALAALALAGGWLVTMHRQRTKELPSLVHVTSASGAPIAWARTFDGSTEWIDLRDGSFRLEIAPHGAEHRVIMRTPDGRIDDLGTVLYVRIAGARTTEVHVERGHVQLWLNVAPGLVLGAGETWDAPASSASSAPSAPTLARPQPQTPPIAAVQPPRHKTPAPSRRDTGEQEDTSYLAVIRLLREGRHAEARAAANDYLRRFPQGFRRDELRRMVEQPTDNGRPTP